MAQHHCLLKTHIRIIHSAKLQRTAWLDPEESAWMDPILRKERPIKLPDSRFGRKNESVKRVNESLHGNVFGKICQRRQNFGCWFQVYRLYFRTGVRWSNFLSYARRLGWIQVLYSNLVFVVTRCGSNQCNRWVCKKEKETYWKGVNGLRPRRTLEKGD